MPAINTTARIRKSVIVPSGTIASSSAGATMGAANHTDVQATVVREMVAKQTVMTGGNVSAATVMPNTIGGGGNGKMLLYSIEAGQNLGGQRVVMMFGNLLYYYDVSTDNSIGCRVGVTNGAVTTGSMATVILEGVVNNPGWGLTANGVYYIAANGLISLTPPTSGVCFRVGVAIDSDNLLLDFSEEIFLN